jgi:hypothetical protein
VLAGDQLFVVAVDVGDDVLLIPLLCACECSRSANAPELRMLRAAAGKRRPAFRGHPLDGRRRGR